MDLGIRGKKAIVCASSRGLGKGCALALAEAGCDLVVNGRDAEVLARTATEIRDRFGVAVTEVPGDVADPAVQKELLAACPQPDILVNNNGGPPYRPFSELDREAILKGVTNNMVAPLELIQAVIGGMAERGFGRIVNITSLSVYMPIPGLDLSSGAQGRPDLLPRRRGADRRRQERDHQSHAARQARHRPAARAARSRARSRTLPPARQGARALPPTFRPNGSERRRSSARSAPSSARSMPAI